MARYVADGTTIARQNTLVSPAVYVAIPQVVTIGSVGSTRGLIDVTNLSSAAREYMKAIRDGQEIQLECQYDPDDTVHAALRADEAAETPRSFRITLTDSPAQTITFDAQVTSWVIGNIAIDQVLTLTVTLKPTGALTFA